MSATTIREGPQAIFQIYFGMMPGRALAAAVQLDIFSPLADGPRDAAAVAAAVNACPAGRAHAARRDGGDAAAGDHRDRGRAALA